MRKILLCGLLLTSSSIALAQAAPEAAPGLRIPGGERPWALDEFHGQPQLVPVHSSAVQTNNHRGSNLAGGLLAGPFYKSKFTTEIDGEHAQTVVHTGTPVFYLHLGSNADSGQSMMAGWAIVHAAVDKGRRLLSTVKFTQFTGNAKRNDTQVEATTESLPDGWLRITPKQPLPSGEYALAPVLRQENGYSLQVFDFRVNPAAENDADAVGKEAQSDASAR